MQPSITKALRALFELGDGSASGHRYFQEAHGVEDGGDDDFISNGSIDHHVIETAGGPVGAEVVFYKLDAVAINGIDEFFCFLLAVSDLRRRRNFSDRGA